MRSLFRDFARGRENEKQAPSASADAVAALVVGLGNPGKEHAGNRHNIGFWCVNRLARRAGASFSEGGKLAAFGETTLAGRRVALAKPRTYVNESGKAVAALLRRYRLTPQDLIVICDDLDRDVGAIRVRGHGGHGGQNGLRSIIASIQSEDFSRVRIGIGRPTLGGRPTRQPEEVAAYVLAEPPRGEREKLEAAVALASEAVELLLAQGLEAAMGRYNTRPNS